MRIRNTATKKKLFIFTNGELTEFEYFQSYKDFLKQPRRVVVKFVKEDPINLIESVIKRKKNKKINGLSREDEIWLVFDVDDFLKQNPKKFESAIKNAEEHGLKIAWSNECFELWFLLHFQCVDSNIPRKNYHTQLSKNLKKLSFDYSKNRNIKTLFEICKHLEENAVKNATKIDEGKISKNPSTKIYELIKKLNE